MSITSSTSKVRASGNGVTTAFPFSFRIFLDTDLEVYIIEADGTEILKTISTDYTVAFTDAVEGGTVNMIVEPALGEDLLVRRQIDATQPSVFNKESNFPEITIENSFDRNTMLIQQLEEAVDRAILQPIGSTLTVTFPEPESGKIVRWLGSTGEMENADIPSVNIAGDELSGSVNITGNLEIGVLEGAGDAALRLNHADKSLLLNRLTTAQETGLTGEDGMFHWNTTLEQYRGHRGSQFYSIGENQGRKNKIINGRFNTWIEGDVTRLAATGSGTSYFADMWRFVYDGDGFNTSALTIEETAFDPDQTDVPNEPKKYANIDITTVPNEGGASSVEKIASKIYDIRELGSNKVSTVSFWARSTIASQEVAIWTTHSYGSGGSPTADVETFLGRVTITSDWAKYQVQLTSPTLDGTLGTNEDSSILIQIGWQYGSTIAAAIGDGGGALGVQGGGGIQIADAQAEKSSVATDIDGRFQSDDNVMISERFQRMTTEDFLGDMYVSGGNLVLHLAQTLSNPMNGSPSINTTINSVVLFQDASDGSGATSSDEGNWALTSTSITSGASTKAKFTRVGTVADRSTALISVTEDFDSR